MAHPDLSPEQRAWFDSATALIDNERLYRLNREITAIHSPTGRERAASEYMVRYLADIGVEATYQPMGEASGHAIGRIRGSGGGPSLLLYAPMMVAVFAAISLALICGWFGRRSLAVVLFVLSLALSIGLFLFEIYSPEYGFRMPWIQTDFRRMPERRA